MLRAVAVVRKPAVNDELVVDTVTLTADARAVHSDIALGDKGLSFLVDLSKEIVVRDGDALKLEGGKLVRVVAANEPVLEVTAENPLRLMKAAWVLGGMHVPVAFDKEHLLIPDDDELAETIRGLGCTLTPIEAQFNPERVSSGCGCGGHGRDHDHHHHEHKHSHDHDAKEGHKEAHAGKCCGGGHGHQHD